MTRTFIVTIGEADGYDGRVELVAALEDRRRWITGFTVAEADTLRKPDEVGEAIWELVDRPLYRVKA